MQWQRKKLVGRKLRKRVDKKIDRQSISTTLKVRNTMEARKMTKRRLKRMMVSKQISQRKRRRRARKKRKHHIQMSQKQV